MVLRRASLTSRCSLLKVNMFETLAYRGIGEYNCLGNPLNRCWDSRRVRLRMEHPASVMDLRTVLQVLTIASTHRISSLDKTGKLQSASDANKINEARYVTSEHKISNIDGSLWILMKRSRNPQAMETRWNMELSHCQGIRRWRRTTDMVCMLLVWSLNLYGHGFWWRRFFS